MLFIDRFDLPIFHPFQPLVDDPEYREAFLAKLPETLRLFEHLSVPVITLEDPVKIMEDLRSAIQQQEEDGGKLNFHPGKALQVISRQSIQQILTGLIDRFSPPSRRLGEETALERMMKVNRTVWPQRQVSRNPLLLGLPLPNLGFNQFEAIVERLGNMTEKSFERAQNIVLKSVEPLEDARTRYLTERDDMLADRLDGQEAALKPMRNAIEDWGNYILGTKKGLDAVVESTILVPVNQTVDTLGAAERRIMNNLGYGNVLRTCILNPKCCGEPASCV